MQAARCPGPLFPLARLRALSRFQEIRIISHYNRRPRVVLRCELFVNRNRALIELFRLLALVLTRKNLGEAVIGNSEIGMAFGKGALFDLNRCL